METTENSVIETALNYLEFLLSMNAATPKATTVAIAYVMKI
jgi:hypothetical protein